MFTIDKSVPLHSQKRSFPPSKYPFEAMNVGDSFFVPAVERKERINGNIRSAAGFFARKSPGFKVAIRSVDGGLRVWRVS